jgi:hypothetical protein
VSKGYATYVNIFTCRFIQKKKHKRHIVLNEFQAAPVLYL